MNVFSQNIFWVNCFFIKFWFSWRKLWNPGKKTCQGCYTFLLRVQRNDQWKELFSRKIYTTPSFGSRALKKFNSRRRSFTNVVSVPFNVFSGKFSGKQVVLEKHTNFHQFWILKQNSIETSQKKLENNVNTDFYVPSWTFNSKKVFYCVRNISFFSELLLEFDGEKLKIFAKTPWQGCQNCIIRVQRNEFRENNFFCENCSLFNFWLSRRRLWLLQKVLVRVV